MSVWSNMELSSYTSFCIIYQTFHKFWFPCFMVLPRLDALLWLKCCTWLTSCISLRVLMYMYLQFVVYVSFFSFCLLILGINTCALCMLELSEVCFYFFSFFLFYFWRISLFLHIYMYILMVYHECPQKSAENFVCIV